MPKFMARLKENYNKEIGISLKEEAIDVVYVTKLIPNFVIIETEKCLQELQIHTKFKSVEKEAIGRIDV